MNPRNDKAVTSIGVIVMIIAMYWLIGRHVDKVWTYLENRIHSIFTQNSSEQFLSDRSNFSDSLKYWGESSDLTNSSDERVSTEKTKKVINLVEQSIKSSTNVSDSFLDYLDPQLKEHYREELIKGEQIYSEGLSLSGPEDTVESISVKKQLQGTNLIKNWLDWWYQNNKRITNRAFN